VVPKPLPFFAPLAHLRETRSCSSSVFICVNLWFQSRCRFSFSLRGLCGLRVSAVFAVHRCASVFIGGSKAVAVVICVYLRESVANQPLLTLSLTRIRGEKWRTI
jgi:hypothetical protein